VMSGTLLSALIFTAMFYLYKAAPPQVQAYNPNGNRLAYATTKGAIVTLTKALAQPGEGCPGECRCPGSGLDSADPSTRPDDKVKHFGEKDLLNRPALPAESAPAFVYLASHDSSCVTCSVMDLTGGRQLA